MYAGVDIGGTKTLIGLFDDQGDLVARRRFPTPKTYPAFLRTLRRKIASLDLAYLKGGCVAAPGRVDRRTGMGIVFGNLPWRRVPLGHDIAQLFGCPIIVENDANLGGLSEALLLPPQRVLYVTISTGIGTGFISNHQIVAATANGEGGHMQFMFNGERTKWESFASGHAIVNRFGKTAHEITDTTVWKRVASDMAPGFIALIAVLQPETIVIGGSVGAYFKRFNHLLLQEIRRTPDPLVPIPRFKRARRPDSAVMYGCYALAKATYA